MFAYPTTIDATSSFMSLAKALRDGTLTSNVAQTAQDAWTVQGYAQSNFLGETRVFGAGIDDVAEQSHDEMAAQFEAAAMALDSQAKGVVGDGPVGGKINWQQLFKNLMTILEIIRPFIPATA